MKLPITVIVDRPVAVEPLTFSVKVLVRVVGLGLNEPVTPLGKFAALRVTSWSKPSAGTTVIVVVPLLPCATVLGLGEAVSLKFPSARTVSAKVVVAVRPSDVPVIFMVAVPSVAVALTVNVSVLLLKAGFGLNPAVTPLGKPEAERVTRFFSGLMMIVLVPVSPCTTLNWLGEAANVRPGFTVSFAVVVLVKLPETPVMVSVTVPVAAVAFAVRVRVLVAVAGFGLNEAVTPFGRPAAERVTLPENPCNGVTEIPPVPWLA